MLIDMHAHVIPDELGPVAVGPEGPRGPRVESTPADPASRVLLGAAMRFPTPPIWFSAERRLEAMDRDGVDREVVSPMPALLDYTLAPAEGRELSRRANEFVARLCGCAPERLFGLGMVPLQAPDVAAAELEQVAAFGLKGWSAVSQKPGRIVRPVRSGAPPRP